MWRGALIVNSVLAGAAVILAWCLFGTAALGAVAVGVAPQWANSLLHPASVPAPATENVSPSSNAQSVSIPSAISPDNAAGTAPAGADQGQTKPAKTVRHAKKHTPNWLSLNPTYWGLPSQGTRTEPR